MSQLSARQEAPFQNSRPSPGILQGLNKALEVFPSPEHSEEGGHVAGDGADFLLSEVTEALKLMKTESSLLTYLDSLLDLRGSPYLYTTKRATRLNLQVHPAHTSLLCLHKTLVISVGSLVPNVTICISLV